MSKLAEVHRIILRGLFFCLFFFFFFFFSLPFSVSLALVCLSDGSLSCWELFLSLFC